MGRTACTEPQCLYSTAIPLLPLWAVRSVQRLSASARVHLTFYICIIQGAAFNVTQKLTYLFNAILKIAVLA